LWSAIELRVNSSHPIPHFLNLGNCEDLFFALHFYLIDSKFLSGNLLKMKKYELICFVGESMARDIENMVLLASPYLSRSTS